MSYGWAGSVRELLTSDPEQVVTSLDRWHRASFREVAAREQLRAWDGQLRVLSSALASLDKARHWGLVLEYELPFEGGRRPDKVLLAGDHVVPLELKESSVVNPAHVDQARAYGRDLAEYHSECRERPVLPTLALPNISGLDRSQQGVRVVGREGIVTAFGELPANGNQIELRRWLGGTYAPLPSLVEAARRIFRDEPLPYIKRAESAGVPELLQWLAALVESAAARGERHLVLITGVPGSGKTLVGLQFVHECSTGNGLNALFLSGNDPLVDVLQDALKSKVFVHRMHDFVLEYGVRRRSLPLQRILVFDEAQRAWDRERMQLRKNHGRSEPEILMQLAAELPDWAVVIGLVGEGQEIYLGEEAGLGQWREAALPFREQLTVHAPSHVAAAFDGLHVTSYARLNLTLSLRTHQAERAHEWVHALMSGDVESARQRSHLLREAGFDIHVTSRLAAAKDYALRRYDDAPTKRFGLLASSKARNLRLLGVDNEYYAMQRMKIGPWFNAPREDPRSCCQLIEPATEFQCQGLELDLPIVCWGDDLGWDGQWVSYRRTRAARDSHQLRLNSYRVLLTRGRDGAVIWVPENLRGGQQRALVDLLREAGASDL